MSGGGGVVCVGGVGVGECVCGWVEGERGEGEEGREGGERGGVVWYGGLRTRRVCPGSCLRAASWVAEHLGASSRRPRHPFLP